MDERNNLKKTEMHVHSAPVSVCAELGPAELADKYAAAGYEAMVLTNHYSRAYIEKHGVTYDEWLAAYIDAYRQTRDACARNGIEVFLGAEVTLFQRSSAYFKELYDEKTLDENYADYLLYGVTEEFLRSSAPLFELTLPALHEVCKAANVLLVQAHPYRVEQSHSLKDVRFLDGLEINGNTSFSSGPHEAEILSVARKNGLVVTCGTDTHYGWHRLNAAAYIPREIHDSVALAEYLRKVRTVDYRLDLYDPNPLPPPAEWLARHPGSPYHDKTNHAPKG